MDNMGYLPSLLQCSNPLLPTLQSTVPEFDRFAKFSKVHIIKLLSEVENRIWSLALKGASDQVADRFFHLMESGQEEEIRTDFKLLCNVRRKNVEEAQRPRLPGTVRDRRSPVESGCTNPHSYGKR